MRTRDIVMELPDAALSWLREGPWTAPRLSGGASLADALTDPSRAAAWVNDAPASARDALKLILMRFGHMPFPEEKLMPEGGKPPLGWTGAELRMAVQQLRRDGILFAMDRPWGDRLLVLPEDMFAVWRRLLLPLNVEPLPEEVWMEGCDAAASLLSHELIAAWSVIRGTGLPLTSKGTPRKQETARIASAMRIRPEECPVRGAPPAWEGLPPSADLALRMGRAIGMLRQRGRTVVAEPDAVARAWLALPAAEAELRLMEIAAVCLLPAGEPGAWLAAESLRDLSPMRWYRTADIARAMPTGDAADASAAWVRFLLTAGWMESGGDADGAAVRWTVEPSEARLGASADGYDRYELMPDLEAIVPPEVPPGIRWELELMARRLSEDVVAVYRLDADACRRARAGGLTLEDARSLLERGSGAPLPGAVEIALRDWFHEPEAVSMGGEAEPETGRAMTDAAAPESPPFASSGGPDEDFFRPAASAYPDPNGQARIWDARPPLLSRKLYPGADGIPQGWLRQPAAYHASTRRELVERAIGWRAALRLEREGDWIDFAPERVLSAEGGGWRAWGRPFVREAGSGRPICAESPMGIDAAEIGRLMIALPGAERESGAQPTT
ncbi:helicase-associated domain-containing protein [Cohnella sp. JJ-181]|uniref:helicase-associated domain-containing protein n=1 Tax=Cohnella rhizoplanae TaxID=2974897 RepID=UPI0022FF785A|nr:helicase-associated domain-containing protein [Cohnella sp. JJ-181]CAI6022673.1 hypothetical protein COHCIP112018_00377 [Cohnella sp. JJ-181]